MIAEPNTASATSWVGLRLDPLDTLFFRDGRPFDAANRVQAGLPHPQTLAGALRTALLGETGFSFGGFREELVGGQSTLRQSLENNGGQPWIIDARFRGPWFGLVAEDGRIEPLLSQPLNLVKKKNVDEYLRLAPLENGELPGWSDPQGLLPMWAPGLPDAKAQRGLVTLSTLKTVLCGQPLSVEQVIPLGDVYGYDNRIGIELNRETLTSEEGRIYGIRMLAVAPKVCIYAEMSPGADPNRPAEIPLPPLIPFGGEGRYVRAQKTAPCDWPRPDPNRRRAFWYLATPAWYGAGKTLPELPGMSVRAGAALAPLAVSGWNVARNGPRPTRYVIPAGAVYFVEHQGSHEHESLCTDGEMAQEGWGFALQGDW